MKTLNSFNCPERDELVRGGELGFADEQGAAALNFEAGTPLSVGTPYLIVPQQNTGRRYNVNGNKVVSKRFWAIALEGGELTNVARTIGLSSMRGMFVGRVVAGSDAPTFEVQKNDQGKLRAVVANYGHAMADTSFIHGNTETLRAEITKPVIVIPTARGGVYTLEYDNTTRDVKTNASGKALASENNRFYQFALGETPSKELVDVATASLKAAYPDDFYPIA